MPSKYLQADTGLSYQILLPRGKHTQLVAHMLIYGGGSSRAHRKPLNTALELKKKKKSNWQPPHRRPHGRRRGFTGPSPSCHPGKGRIQTAPSAKLRVPSTFPAQFLPHRPTFCQKKKKNPQSGQKPEGKTNKQTKALPHPAPPEVQQIGAARPGASAGPRSSAVLCGEGRAGDRATAPARPPARLPGDAGPAAPRR